MTDAVVPPPGNEANNDYDFESLGHDNGWRYWWESDLRRLLGYESGQAWDKAKGGAMAACAQLGIPIAENFDHCANVAGDEPVQDCKLSRFACYMIAINGDPRKPQVAKAQAYFATFAEAARQMVLHAEGMERVLVRGEISEREKSLNAAAHSAGVVNYAFFQNAGYRGLYNMNLKELLTRKGVNSNRTLLDFMGKDELAANLFRITQTEAKIKSENVKGQGHLEQTAQNVGAQVRRAMREISGQKPEDLPITADIKQVKSGMKQTAKGLKKMDARKELPPGNKDVD